MLKKKAFNKIFITTIIFFLVFSISTIKEITKKETLNKTNKTTYIDYLYTINNDNYISKTAVYVSKDLSLKERIKEKLEIMIKENNKNSLLPSYFNPILPKNTKIENIEIEDSIIKLYFSKELMNITKTQSENMIEAITYTILEENILGIEIYVDGNMMKYVPHTQKELPTILTKEFGINKTYNITSMDDIVKITMTYYSENEGEYYETPVTKYINAEKKEKIELIFEDLQTITNKLNLLTLMDDIEIKNYKINNKTMTLSINKKLSRQEEDILKKSILSNYNIKKIDILVND